MINDAISIQVKKLECPHQFLAVVALVMVSCVVNVFEAMTKSVVSGSHFLRVSAMWVPSMLETKWTLGPTRNGFKASVTIRGPRSVLSQGGQRVNEKNATTL